jgi:hypothetical protein
MHLIKRGDPIWITFFFRILEGFFGENNPDDKKASSYGGMNRVDSVFVDGVVVGVCTGKVDQF